MNQLSNYKKYLCGVDVCLDYILNCIRRIEFSAITDSCYPTRTVNSEQLNVNLNHLPNLCPTFVPKTIKMDTIGILKKNDDIIVNIDEIVERSENGNLNVIENYLDLV